MREKEYEGRGYADIDKVSRRRDLDELIKSTGDLDFLVNAAAADPDPIVRDRAFRWLDIKANQLARFAKNGQQFATHSTMDLGATVTRRVANRIMQGLRFNDMDHLHNYLRLCVKNRIRQIVRRRVFQLLQSPGRCLPIGSEAGQVDPADNHPDSLEGLELIETLEALKPARQKALAESAEPRVIEYREKDPPLEYKEIAALVRRSAEDCRQIYSRYCKSVNEYAKRQGLGTALRTHDKTILASGAEVKKRAETSAISHPESVQADVLEGLLGIEVFIIRDRLESQKSYHSIADATSINDELCRQIVLKFLEAVHSKLATAPRKKETRTRIVDSMDEVGVRIVQALGEQVVDEARYHQLAGELAMRPEECQAIHNAYRLTCLETDYAAHSFEHGIDVKLTDREKQVIELREPDCEMPPSFEEISKRVGLSPDICAAIYNWYETRSDEELQNDGYTLPE